MLLYAGTRTNEWLEAQGKSTLLLMSGEVPASVKELSGQYAHDLIKNAVCAIEVSSRSNGRFTQFMHGRMIKKPNFFDAQNRLPIQSAVWAGKKDTYRDMEMLEFNMSQHISRIFYDFDVDRYAKEYNFGSQSGSNYAMVFDMGKAVHVNALHSNISFATSTFYGHWFGGRITATDFTQSDDTLDVSGATENQTVRIMNAASLPSEFNGVQDIFNGVVLQKQSDGTWLSLGLNNSFEWVKGNSNKMTISYNNDIDVLDDPTYVAGKEKFQFYKLESDSTSSYGLKGQNFGVRVEAEDLPDFANLPKQTITWGVVIPQVDDSSSYITYRSEVTGDAPMFLLDVGVPNSGAAATINNAVDVDHTTDITLMNLKVAVNWMEELA